MNNNNKNNNNKESKIITNKIKRIFLHNIGVNKHIKQIIRALIPIIL